jgi:hypothetical protein
MIEYLRVVWAAELVKFALEQRQAERERAVALQNARDSAIRYANVLKPSGIGENQPNLQERH